MLFLCREVWPILAHPTPASLELFIDFYGIIPHVRHLGEHSCRQDLRSPLGQPKAVMFYTLEDEQTLWLGDERIAVVREIVGTYSYQLGAIVGNEWIKQSPVLVTVERRYDRSQSVDHVTREFRIRPMRHEV
jgi:hypothetical protein